MSKEFVINSNQKLVDKAKEILRRDSYSNREEKIAYYNKLCEIEKEIFDYKEETFGEVDKYLKDNSIYTDVRAIVYLNIDIEEVLNNIMTKKIEMWSPIGNNKVHIEYK